MPEQDAVLAITSGVKDMQAVLDIAWDKLLPGMQPSSLPSDDGARQKLEQRLKGLVVRVPDGTGSPAPVAGKKYVFPANPAKLESIALDGDAKEGPVTIVARVGGSDRRIPCGRGAWQKGRLAWGRQAEQPAAAAGAWTADDTFTAKICFYETPFITTVRLKFTGDEVRVASETNVGFGPTRESELVGGAG